MDERISISKTRTIMGLIPKGERKRRMRMKTRI